MGLLHRIRGKFYFINLFLTVFITLINLSSYGSKIGVVANANLEIDINNLKERGLAQDPVTTLLLVSTIDGTLTALDRHTGHIRWTSKDEPMIRVPDPVSRHEQQTFRHPYFLPDPKTGSLYLLGKHGQLKKLPFTIPQLVNMSPCRSSEGLFYTGKKMDVWLKLNPFTGEKSDLLSYGESTCPAQASGPGGNSRNILIGKTEYTVSMFEGTRKWNVTFHDYSSIEMNPQSVQDYDFAHITSPSTGNMMTYERESGHLLWQVDLKSTVIGLYSIDCALSTLVSIPFTAVTSEALKKVDEERSHLTQTLYIGECPYGLYAVPSFVDKSVIPISSRKLERFLIAGPTEEDNNQNESKSEPSTTKENEEENMFKQTFEEQTDKIYLGHYEVPNEPSKLPTHPHLFIEDKNESSNEEKKEKEIPGKNEKNPTSPFTFPPPFIREDKSRNTESYMFISFVVSMVLSVVSIILVGYFVLYKRENHVTIKYLSGPDGTATVGKITFNPSAVLGKGCEGTFVFRGKFENRDVAVKRILPECFTFADKESNLLQETDTHPNVIRYFCTESDGQFRYIALELCAATLADWVEGRYEHPSISAVELLREATEGLAHLHKKNIVHRDIKPANVLLNVDQNSGNVRAMISDFGLCKKLATGRMSFSRRSGGIPGTEGWIAPEMIRYEGNERTTYSVDTFSLGCVFYYVLTKGNHPFGEPLERQSKILAGDLSLDELKDDRGTKDLIQLMLKKDAIGRPPPSAILAHPLFWNKEKVLAFFLDSSDRIEKEADSCLLIKRLEGPECLNVVRKDWRDFICSHVCLDLRKYRTYKGSSVRDLLRALRNKKNHYRELTPEAQESLGQIPDQFVDYWVSKFPLLLQYTWKIFEVVKEEPMFKTYYSDHFNFATQDELVEGDEKMYLKENVEGNWRERDGELSTDIPNLDRHFWKAKQRKTWRKQTNQQPNQRPPIPTFYPSYFPRNLENHFNSPPPDPFPGQAFK